MCRKALQPGEKPSILLEEGPTMTLCPARGEDLLNFGPTQSSVQGGRISNLGGTYLQFIRSRGQTNPNLGWTESEDTLGWIESGLSPSLPDHHNPNFFGLPSFRCGDGNLGYPFPPGTTTTQTLFWSEHAHLGCLSPLTTTTQQFLDLVILVQKWPSGFTPSPPPTTTTQTNTLSFLVGLPEFGYTNAYRRELRLKQLMIYLKV